TFTDSTQDDAGSTIAAGMRRGDLRPGTDGRLEVADNVLAASIYTCSRTDGCVLIDGHPAPCRTTRTAPEHVPDRFDHAAAVQAIALSDAAARKIRSSKSANTQAAYQRDWDKWADWCTRNRVIALPAAPEAVANYVAEAAEMVRPNGKPAYAPSTLTRMVASINSVHKAAGAPPPGHSETVRAALSGIRREAARPPRRMKALTLDPLRVVLTSIPLHGWPIGVHGRRDYALILIGMAGAFRRGELAAITTDRCDLDPEQGLLIRLHQSKGDQEARGMTKVIPYGANPSTCGPCAWVRWLLVLDAAHTGERSQVMRAVLTEPDLGAHVCKSQHLPGWATDGSSHPAFVTAHRHGDITLDHPMSGQAVHQVLRRRLAAAGIDPTRWGAHSLRAGFITQSLRTGATYTAIMNQTGQKKPETVEVYSREHTPSENNSVTRLGL
ncbi:MAG: tyrosine-type recombinase/integrase, partial [Brachybacterium sp.]|nr:tyrosine-type recombinase/integrase [Brachybacterium sp.]